MSFRVVNGCPVGKNIAPYIAIVCADAGAVANSIYRGTVGDAPAILEHHGHMDQAQLFTGFIDHEPGYLPANPPGFSTHELFSDGVAYPDIARGKELDWWMQGFDVDDDKVPAVIKAGAAHGWELWQPYPSGTEFHHLNFRARPRPTPRTAVRIIHLRATLPRR